MKRLTKEFYILVMFFTLTSSTQLCPNVEPEIKIPCQCDKSRSGEISLNCDYVVFEDDFPLLPFKMQIVDYRQRYAGLQGLTSQLFTASQIPLKKLDFSHNGIRKLNGRVFDGLEDSLESLMLQHNRFGDVYSQRLSLPEVSRLTSLKNLDLGFNEIQALDVSLLRNLSLLQVLQLEGNLLMVVPTEQMSGLNSLKVLTLQENDLDLIGEGAFHTIPNLVFINVSYNEIENISNRAFFQLKNLTALDLSHNRLVKLEPEVFQGLTSLEDLDLSSNFFSEIPADAFKELDILKTLQMQNNRIQTLGGIVAFGPSSSLSLLDLTRNSIVNLESRTFKRLTQLQTLKLSVNSIGKRKSDAFDGLDNLEVLELDDHRFFSFPSNMLAMTPSLRSLSLNFNRIRVITNESLKVVNKLRELSIANNIIQEILEGTFYNFSRLTLLNLSGNKITKLHKDSLKDVAKTIQELNVGKNLLSTLPEFDLPQLSKLIISGNEITHLSEKVFLYLPELQYLDMSRNKFVSLSVKLFEPLSRLGSLDLGYNKLTNLQSGQFNGTVINVINLKGNKIKEINKYAFENLLFLTSLDMSENRIEVIKEGALYDASFLHILNLSNNKLTSFNKNIFTFPRNKKSQLRFLDLSNNEITFLKEDALSPHPRIIWLSLSKNRLSFFPVNALKNLKNINQLDLSENEFESIGSSDFANIKSLRELNLNKNKIFDISENAFQNSTQLQELNLCHNKIKHLDENSFKGIAHLSLDLSYNRLSGFPEKIFERTKVKILSLNIAHNVFTKVPVKALRPQYSYFSDLNMSHNNVSQIPNNADILVNMKSLDLSYNPLTSHDILELLNEPKLLRSISLAGTKITDVPLIEARFLTYLNLSDNEISEVSDKTFKLTHNLRTLDLSNNKILNSYSGFSSAWPELPNLRYLDISDNPITSITKDGFKGLNHIKVFRAHDLPNLNTLDTAAFNDIKLRELYIYNIPMLHHLDIQKILDPMPGLEKFDVELKHNMIDEEIRGVFSPRLHQLSIRGENVKEIKSSAFLYLNSPNLNLGIVGTNISTLDERMLFLVPMSSNIILSVNDSQIETLSQKFLEDVVVPREKRLRILGLENNPLYCDCHFLHLYKYVINSKDENLKNATCHGPKILKGKKIVNLVSSQLICTERKREKSNLNVIITKDELNEQIVKHKLPEKELTSEQVKFTGMDKIIIGVVGGVIGFVALLILIVCLFRLLCDSRARNGLHHVHTHENCTCVKPPVPTNGYPGPYSIPTHPNSRAGTLKSHPPTSPIPPPYGTLGSHSRNSYYAGPPSYMGMYYQDEHDYR